MAGIEKAEKKILVAGDAMLDAYHFGQVNRISPEAPVPVFLETSNNRFVPGGAANVAVNIAAIGADVSLCAVIGDDANGREFIRLMDENNVDTHLVSAISERKTITKLRYIGPGNQQILRVDDEDVSDLSDEYANRILETVKREVKEYDVVVLSDYNKGFLTKRITSEIIRLSHEHNIPVLVDVKDKDFTKYGNATLLKPNRKELALLTGMPVENEADIVAAEMFLCRSTPCRYVLTTLGAEGMILADKDGMISHIESVASEVFDVTGAGDTSIAYLAVEIVKGTEIREAVKIANYAAGVQVSKVGTSIVTPEEVAEAMREDGATSDSKILDYYDRSELSAVNKCHKLGKKIVFTNGCFDILHIGHITYLKKARQMGDILIVGVNSDDSVRRLKGKDRPVNPLKDRLEMLAALDFVDYVIPFEEDTPLDLIKAVLPDVLVKGGDYKPDDIVGAKEVIANGGEVRVIPFVEGHSTSQIIQRIQEG